jgi:hypothetical protein
MVTMTPKLLRWEHNYFAAIGRELRHPTGAYDARPHGLLGNVAEKLKDQLPVGSRIKLVRALASDQEPQDGLGELAQKIKETFDPEQIERLCDLLMMEDGEDEELTRNEEYNKRLRENPEWSEDRRRRRVAGDDPPPFSGRPEVGKGPAMDAAIREVRAACPGIRLAMDANTTPEGIYAQGARALGADTRGTPSALWPRAFLRARDGVVSPTARENSFFERYPGSDVIISGYQDLGPDAARQHQHQFAGAADGKSAQSFFERFPGAADIEIKG